MSILKIVNVSDLFTLSCVSTNFFQGVMIGNAFVDPSEISNVTYPFLYFGLLNREQIEIVNPLLKAFQQDIANNNSIGAKNVSFTS